MTFPDVRLCGVELFGLKTREALSAREGRDLSHPIAQSPPLQMRRLLRSEGSELLSLKSPPVLQPSISSYLHPHTHPKE